MFKRCFGYGIGFTKILLLSIFSFFSFFSAVGHGLAGEVQHLSCPTPEEWATVLPEPKRPKFLEFAISVPHLFSSPDIGGRPAAKFTEDKYLLLFSILVHATSNIDDSRSTTIEILTEVINDRNWVDAVGEDAIRSVNECLRDHPNRDCALFALDNNYIKSLNELSKIKSYSEIFEFYYQNFCELGVAK